MSTYDFSDPSTQQQWVNVLLHGCYNSRQVIEQAVLAVTPQELAQVMRASVGQVILYESMLSYWREFKAPAPPQAMAIAVNKLVGQLLAYGPEQRQAILNEVVHLYTTAIAQPFTDTSTQLSLAIVRHVYTKARVDPQLSQILQDNLESGKVDDVFKRVSALKSQTRTDKVPKNVFSLAKDGNLGQLFSSGLSWLDELIGGGFRYGEAYGLLAETGGGKTTITAHLACALAAQGRKVMVIVTEQSFGEISLRAKYWATIAKQPWEEFLKYDDIDVIPDDFVSPAVKSQIKVIQSNILAFDMSDVSSMLDVVDLASQFKPDLLILDWAGTLADRLMQEKDNAWNNDRALCLRAIANDMNTIAKQSKIATLVHHQLAPAAGKNPFRDYDHTMAMECKSFFFNLSYALIMAPRDKRDVMRISCTKSRLSARKDCIVRLNGAMASFEPLAGYRRGAQSLWAPPSASSNNLPDAKGGGGDKL
jgi:KaiC/GvpD/RAD55 family RecA-like ATPase